MASKIPQDLSQFESLLQIIRSLRGENGCPWINEQDHKSLTKYAIEESFELCESIEKNDLPHIREELGDLLLQVVLHARIAEQEGQFQVSDVIKTLNEKLIRRHPHVFSDASVEGTKDVIENWEKIKQSEKSMTGSNFSLNVPHTLPALQRAHKIGERTEKLKFDWDSADQVWEKLEEEKQELAEALQKGDKSEMRHEIGDLLFTIAQLARHLDLDPEESLRSANIRFENRFLKMFQIKPMSENEFKNLSSEEKDTLWRTIKQKEQILKK